MLRHFSATDLVDLYLDFPVAACLVSREGTYLAANRKFADLVEAPYDGLVGRHISDVCGEEVHARGRRDFEILDAGGLLTNHELPFRGRFYLVAVRPMWREVDGTVAAICMALTDITEQKHQTDELALINLQLNQANARLAEMARTDALTGLWNRLALEELLPREIARSRRDSTAISVLLADIDHFKSYNDRYGHIAGDQALQSVAHAMRKALLHPGDFLVRYGGEEFLVVLPATPAAGAMVVADNIRKSVETLGIAHDASPLGVLTISLGVASLRHIERSSDITGARIDLIQRADQALYRVKTTSRNGIGLCDKNKADLPFPR